MYGFAEGLCHRGWLARTEAKKPFHTLLRVEAQRMCDVGLVTRMSVLPVPGGHTRDMAFNSSGRESMFSLFFPLCSSWAMDTRHYCITEDKHLPSVYQLRDFSRETTQADLEAMCHHQRRWNKMNHHGDVPVWPMGRK